MDLHMVEIHVEGHITGVQEIIGEVLFNHITLITTADHKLVDPVVAIGFENVPEDWFAADFHHRFWLEMGFLGKACPESTRKENIFHKQFCAA